ncbi:MAG: PAS domain S-box protein [Cyanobacteria bacterium SZAS TMP-1]|nr:PAS domain S-box protein [Cyanobacteria bacterium SZAS TMP-1]
MILRPGIARKGLVIIVLILVCELSFVALIAAELVKTRARLRQEQHNLAVIETSSRIANASQRLATYLSMSASELEQSTGIAIDESGLRRSMAQDFEDLALLARDDAEAGALLAEQRKFLRAMDDVYRKDMAYSDNSAALKRAGLTPAVMTFQKDLLEKYNQLATSYRSSRASSLSGRETAGDLGKLKSIVLIAALLNFAGALILGFFFISNVVRRIQKLASNIDRQIVSVEGEADELGEIERSFKQMLSDIAEAGAREELLINGAFDVICTLNSKGRIETINDASALQWGHPRESLIGGNISQLLESESAETFLRSLQNYAAEARTKSADADNIMTVDTRIKHSSGRLIDTHWTGYFAPQEQSIICFVENISQAKERENQLRQSQEQVSALLKNLPLGILVVDREDRVRSFNKKIAALADPQQLAKGPGNIAIDHIIETHSLERGSILAQAEGRPAMRAYIRGAGGERIAAEITVQYLERKHDNQLADRTVIAEDVRERVRLENLKRDFVELLREKLGSPLAAVRSDMAELLVSHQDAVATSETRIKRIVSNADRLLQLIESLINVETLRPGKIIGELKRTDLRDVLDSAVAALGEYAQAQGISIELSGTSESCWVMADRERLIQVVINLLSNAIKFSPSRGTVKLAAARRADQDFVEVTISDCGRGVPEDKRQAIFEPYQQASAQDKHKGTGLGLAICKTIVEGHGGSIGVAGNDGPGSRFWFRLPAQGGAVPKE